MAECQDNFQIIGSVAEKQWSLPLPSLFSVFFFYIIIISADGGTFRSASSMAPSSELEPIILLLWSCRDSISPSVCWTCYQQRPAHPHWTLFFFLFFCPSIMHLQLSASFHAKNITENICNQKEQQQQKVISIDSVNIVLNGWICVALGKCSLTVLVFFPWTVLTRPPWW